MICCLVKSVIMEHGEDSMINCITVSIGGFIGSVCRYLIGLLPIEASSGFPIKTLAVNVTGSFCIGFIAVQLLGKG